FLTFELPFHAINYCLEEGNIHINEVDHFAYSFDPYQLLPQQFADKDSIPIPLHSRPGDQDSMWSNEWDPLFLSSIVNARLQLQDGYPHHLQKRFVGANIPESKWHFVDHHIAHAASAFHASPFREAAVITIDGRGEKATTTYSVGRDNQLERIAQVNMPHSLGLLYERVTTYLGFLHSSDEYKVMALASYGKPVFTDIFRSMIRIGDDGTYTIENDNLEKHFGPTRLRNEPFTEHHFNIAHSLQLVLEESILKLVDWFQQQTEMENLCLAGGVALNCVANARIRDKSRFKQVWVQPAAGDAGTALGGALWIDSRQRGGRDRNFRMDHVYWGPQYSDEQIQKFLNWTKIRYRKLNDIAVETADFLAADKIIGWFQGRMEFGPRALGSRSILASPINPSMQARLNEVKDREDFRPVAPVVLEEDAAEWFKDAGYSPFMLFVNEVNPDKAALIPAVRHVDGTARIQTVNKAQHPLYHQLLVEFKKRTGVPVLVNTSFNTLGKPIVCTPRDAIECFYGSPFDALVIGSFLLEK
ncbi:MAG TPA: carbamoyltransferase C-terminal domain-containing protein, partial [Flavitalea sp.]|nr:carbamoyltransferase C-terminal domain-containing protein [Flavitalea sp.]